MQVLGLGTMAVIVTFFFVVAGLAGMQLFATYGRYRCFFNGTDASVLDAAGLSIVSASDLIDDLEYMTRLDTVSQYVSAGSSIIGSGGMLDPRGLWYTTCTPPALGPIGQQCNGEYLFNRTGGLTAEVYDAVVCADSTVNPEHWNFDDFAWTCVTLFQCISMVGWTDIMHKTQDSTGWFAVIYFVLVVVFGQYVILNLIIAVLGESYQEAIQEGEAEAKLKRDEARRLRLEKRAKREEAKRLRLEQKLPNSQQGPGDDQGEANGEDNGEDNGGGNGGGNGEDNGRGLTRGPTGFDAEEPKPKKPRKSCLVRLDCFRMISPKTKAKLVKFTTSLSFRLFFMVCVLANVITLSITNNDMTTEAYLAAGEEPNLANIELRTTLDQFEWLFAFLFAVEMLMKMSAVGLPTYLSNGFNMLDALIVACSFFELIAIVVGLRIKDVLSGARALRVFRLFKLASNFKSLREVIGGAIQSVKAVFAVTVIMLVVIFIESIIAMNFFGGKLGDNVGDLVGTHGIRWHFDEFFVAFATTWMCITTEAYTNVMYLAYDRVGVTSIIYFMQLISVA